MPTGDGLPDRLSDLAPLLDSVFSAVAGFGRLPEAEQEALLDIDDDLVVARLVEMFEAKVAVGRFLSQVRSRAPSDWLVTAAPEGYDGDWGAAAAVDLLSRLSAAGVVTVLDGAALPGWARPIADLLDLLGGAGATAGAAVSLLPILPNEGAPKVLNTLVEEARRACAQASAGRLGMTVVLAVACAPSGPSRVHVLADSRVVTVYPEQDIEALCRSDGLTLGAMVEAPLAGLNARIRLLHFGPI